MEPLAERLRRRIREQGPISVADYMEAANAHYYAARDPLGAGGDFVTAPEVSQMFGEMVGAALAIAWTAAGSPPDARYVELGPGRGTLAGDALRVLAAAGLNPPVELVETSPVLREAQRRRLAHANWHDSVATIGGGPLLVVANEFLDALPVRQWQGGVERRVALEGERFVFTPGEGPVREDSPARDSAVAEIAARLSQHGGIALIIDYGHADPGDGDTLQAVRAHGFADVLDKPGEQDLTAHVDFAAVARAAGGVRVSRVVEQGRWLRRLGIEQRAMRLGAANPGRSAELMGALERLTAPDQMGRLFKVIALAAPGWPLPEGLG